MTLIPNRTHVLGFVLLACAPCFANMVPLQTSLWQAEVIEYGIFKAQATRAVTARNTATGERIVVDDVALLERTQRIPAALNTQFGFRVLLHGQPTGEKIKLRVVTDFPHPGMRNPSQDSLHKQDTYTFSAVIGELSLVGYAFTKKWELLPGEWRFRLYHHEKLLMEQRFDVVNP